jgi:hypothetical protein
MNELIPAEADGTANDSHGVAVTIVKLALVTIGAAGIAGWLTLGLVHLRDRYMVGTGAGEWMALARYANEGTLYPPLSDGVRFGGTRYMPLPIVVNAAAARLTGEYLSSGKAVALVLFAALLTLVFNVLRQLHCPWPLAVAMTGLLPATNTGLGVGSTVGGDVLPVVLQVGALLTLTVALRRNTLAGLLAAGVLAGLAVASKLTGAWAALAVLSWLCFQRDWRRLVRFTIACGATAALAFGVVQWTSQGRFLTTFMMLAFAGTGGPVGWIRAPNQLVLFGSKDVAAVWIVAPFAVMAVLASGRFSALNVYHHALWWSLLLTLVVFTDMGVGANQLLDPAVLTIVAVGSLAARLPLERLEALSLSTALTLALGWAGITGVRGFVPDLREVLVMARAGETLPKYKPWPLANVVAPGDTLLTDDPTVPVLLGQTPIVLDAFMLRRLDEVQPDAVDGLVARIERGEFDHVALVTPLEEDDFWWRHYNFGLRIVGALRKSYVFVRMVDGYYLYQPRRDPSGTTGRSLREGASLAS